MRLKRAEVKAFRTDLLRKQDFVCPLCMNNIHPSEATLDHDHTSGHVRRVLHRSCNAAEGKILSWCRRTQSDNPIELLENLQVYWLKDWTGTPIHPAHLTEDQKLMKKYRKLRNRSKRARTKAKYTDLINDLMRTQEER